MATDTTTMAGPAVDPIITAPAVSQWTGWSLRLLAEWRSKRKNLPFVRVGRRVYYKASDVQAYLDKCTVAAVSADWRPDNGREA